MQTWLITGCSSGFGKSIAKAVLERGWNAVVTARNPEDIREFEVLYPDNALTISLDVTDEKAADHAVQAALERFGVIDVLVNNAGYGYRAAVEEGNFSDVNRLFATNFWGPVSLIQKVLPGMRKRHTGAIVNFSSIAAIRAEPGSGYYAASKSALESVSEALFREVMPLGIRVMIVEPGGFSTDFFGRSLTQSEKELSDYAETAGKRRIGREAIDRSVLGSTDKGALQIIEALAVPNPPLRLLLSTQAVEFAKENLSGRLKEAQEWADLSSRSR